MFAKLGGGAGVVILIILLLCISPALFLWSLNSLAELGNVDFYIEHNVWSYWVSLIFLLCVRGGK